MDPGWDYAIRQSLRSGLDQGCAVSLCALGIADLVHVLDRGLPRFGYAYDANPLSSHAISSGKLMSLPGDAANFILLFAVGALQWPDPRSDGHTIP